MCQGPPYAMQALQVSGLLVFYDLSLVSFDLGQPNANEQYVVKGKIKAPLFEGDVVGPGFFEEYLDAENTLRKPFGSAEQNMYNLAYNLYNLKYLKATDQLRQDVLERTLYHLNIGLFFIKSKTLLV